MSMVNQATVRIYQVKSRHSINFPSDFVRDSAFPFEPGEKLIAKIKNGKIVIEKMGVVSAGVESPNESTSE
jgi:hypothetical protein